MEQVEKVIYGNALIGALIFPKSYEFLGKSMYKLFYSNYTC